MIEQINGTATLLREELKSLQNDKENEKINSRLKKSYLMLSSSFISILASLLCLFKGLWVFFAF